MLIAKTLSRLLSVVVLLLLAGLALTACSPLRVLDALTPAGAYSSTPDVAYGPHPRQRLDVYVPEEAADKRPVIVFFYGGNWRQGDKKAYRFVAESLTRQGFVVVLPDYRLYPEAGFPAFLEDSAQAVAWTLANIGGYGGDPRSVVLAGHSAGAYNALMLALDTPYLRASGASRAQLAGVIGIAGPYDFLPLGRTTAAIFAPAADLALTQPINFVDARAPAALLVTGADDDTVRPRNTERLAARLREAGSPVREIVYPGYGHIDILLALSSTLGGENRVMSDVKDFVHSVVGKGEVKTARR